MTSVVRIIWLILVQVWNEQVWNEQVWSGKVWLLSTDVWEKWWF